MPRTGWQVWSTCSFKLWKPILPTIYGGNEPPEWMIKYHQIPPESVGFLADSTGHIWIKDTANCRGVRWHEYGHWAFWRLHHWLDALWELPWWGLGMRRWFI